MNMVVQPPAALERFDASSLMGRIDQAQQLFAAGDLRAALFMSEGAYDEAKAAHVFAARMKLSEGVISTAHAMVVEALEIGSLAKVALANEYDQAQAAGLVAKKGRPKNVAGEDILQISAFGLDRRVILDARKLRDAELASPGVIGRTIAGISAKGMLPTKSNLRTAIGTASAGKEARGYNFYQTPVAATLTLLAHESFTSTVWEPACGHAAISRVLERKGYSVVLSDIEDRGTVSAAGVPQSVGDFLQSSRAVDADEDEAGDGPDIVTNPPYGEALNAFVAHALRVHRPRKLALLLNLNFLAGFADDDRSFVMDECPPARVYVFKRRLPMMHREGYDGPKASSRMNTAWFVWELQDDGTYGQTTTMRRVDWNDYLDSDSLEPGEGGHGGVDFDDAPRKTPRRELHERIDAERARAAEWIAGRTSFSRAEMCSGLGVRDTTIEGVIAELVASGVVSAADAPGRLGRHTVLGGA